MDRRAFLAAAAAGPLLFSRSFARPPAELSADVVIIGGGLGGVAAALGALRLGASVLMTEQTDWIGGQLTAQLVPPDENKWIETYGGTRSYRQLRGDIRDYYRRRTDKPLTAAARANPALNPGSGWVSRLCCEPKVALAVIEQTLAPFVESGRLTILRNWSANSADVAGDFVKAVRGTDRETGVEQTLSGKIFLDATEQGDLLPLANVEHVTGFESRLDTGESGAPEKAYPTTIQSFTVCFIMDYLPNGDFTIPKPEEYDFWRNHRNGQLFDWSQPKFGFDPRQDIASGGKNFWTYRRIIDKRLFEPGAYPSDLTVVNWHMNDYDLGPLHACPPEEAAGHLRRAKQMSLSLLYWLQTEAPGPDDKPGGWKGLRLRADAAGTEDGLAKYPYIRESRRIRAEFTVLADHVLQQLRVQQTGLPKEQVRAAKFRDSVGIGHYPMDIHRCCGPVPPVNLDTTTLPFQIPLGALLPVRMENLLPACKNLGVTHLTNGCYRLHPVEWNIGEAAGALAAFALSKGEPPRAVRSDEKRLAEFQKSLTSAGVVLEWPADARL